MDIINEAGLMCLYYVALPMGAALSTVPRPPVCPSRASDFLEAEKE